MTDLAKEIAKIEAAEATIRRALNEHIFTCLFGRSRANVSGNLLSLGEDYYTLPDLMERLDTFTRMFGYEVTKTKDKVTKTKDKVTTEAKK